MKNIHILPTDKPTYLYEMEGKLYLSDKFEKGNEFWHNQNIYITSDEEIKEGEYQLYNPLGNFDNAKVSKAERLLQNDSRRKKIILTTDQDLIKDGVQAIDDEFLQWFVKNPSCEEVEVDDKLLEKGYTYYRENILKNKNLYKIIIPKEEPKQLNPEDFGLPQFGTKEFNDLASQFFGGKPKQKTQGYICPQTKVQCNDEFCVSAEKCNLPPSTDVFSEPKQEIDMSKYTIGIDPYDKQETLEEAAEQHRYGLPIHNFIRGAKWQQENSYSEEEIRNVLLNINLVNPSHLKMTSNGYGEFPDGYKLTDKGIQYVIEQINKK